MRVGRVVPSALVTGSNRGIGLALCEVLVERAYEVIAVCRRSSSDLDEMGVTVVEGVDVAEPSATDRIRKALGDRPLDLVVANAVRNLCFDIDRPEDLDLELFEGDLRVNVVGAMRTVLAALPNMLPGARVLLVSSGASAPGPQLPGSFGYKATKAALNQLGRSLAHEVAARGILVAVVSPGPTNTALLHASYEAGRTTFDPSEAPDARTSATRLLDTMAATASASSGSFWAHTGEVYYGPDGYPPARAGS
jgi:NAD(P)-dependent dehydrogenase (short-subunit alcohol dehydrogenase family)